MDLVKNLNIGSRLALGFGVLLLMMTAIVVLAAARFTAIEVSTKQLMEQDWVKAEAAHTINATTRTNARRTMELFFIDDKNQLAAIRQNIAENKKTVSESLEILDRLVKTQAGTELLANIKDMRSVYVASFTKVDNLLQAGKRDEASKTLLEETLPSINSLQEDITTLVTLEKKLAETSGIDMERSIETTRSTMLAIGLMATLFGAACAWWLTRSITKPILRAVLVAEQISQGQIGHDISVRAQETHDECERLLKSLCMMDKKLNDIATSVSAGANNVGSAAGQLAQGNNDLSQRTQEQASALEEIAATIEQLTATVKRNSDNTHQADQLVHHTRSQADSSAAVAQQTFDAMEEINNSSRKIADIINVIDEIAFQTNLLALNAAVEAARAGEQGRGFAVVATEVRHLAQRSASAAKEIKLLIGDSVNKVRVGTELVNASGKTLSDLVVGVNRITDVVAEIASASTEQATGINQINMAMMQMDSTTQQNAALVEEAASASKAMENQAHELVSMIGFFRTRGAQAQSSRPQPRLAADARTVRQFSTAKPGGHPLKPSGGQCGPVFLRS